MRILTAVACLLLGGYAVARAVLVPLTYDEAATYLRYISQDFLSVFNFEVATNHFLNTLPTRLAAALAGNSELVLRLPSLIGYALYLWFSISILREIPQRTIAIAGFVLLHLNPYVFDFFALSRGYGISLGLLMGAVHYLLRFASQQHVDSARRDVSRALMFGIGAVLASFSLLDAYLGIAAVVLVLGFFVHRRPSLQASARARLLRIVSLPATAVVFTCLVLSQDHRLTHRLYEPVTVNVVGLDDAELDAISVSRITPRRRAERMNRHGTSIWRIEPAAAVAGVQIEVPFTAAEKIRDGRAFGETMIGGRPFVLGSRHHGLWTAHDAHATVVFESTAALSLPRSRMAQYEPVVNWGGDRNHLGWVAAYTARAMTALAALALALAGIGWALKRIGLVTAGMWQLVTSSLVWVAALAGTPLSLLQRNGELYYGGAIGFVDDTIYSLIQNSFHGRTYVDGQSDIVFALVIAAVVVFAVVGCLCVRRRRGQLAAPAGCLLGVLGVASTAVIAQHWLFETPFPLNRTGLFLIPLFVLFVTFLFDAAAHLGQAGRRLALSAAAVSATLAAAHFIVTANVSYTLEWKHDAATNAMIDDLAAVIDAERPGSAVVLAVERHFSAAAAFYAQECRTATIDVHTIPATRDVDFFYVHAENAGSMTVIKRYPVADAVLTRPAR